MLYNISSVSLSTTGEDISQLDDISTAKSFSGFRNQFQTTVNSSDSSSLHPFCQRPRNNSLGATDDEDDDLWGWFESEKGDNVNGEFTFDTADAQIRDIWVDVIGVKAPLLSSSTSKSVVDSIIYEWNNNNASVSLKLSTSNDEDLTKMLPSLKPSMNISVCVSGFRICQLDSGEISPQFNVIFCYGSISYSSWKPIKEFEELAKVCQYINASSPSPSPPSSSSSSAAASSASSLSSSNFGQSYPQFARTYREWEIVESKRRFLFGPCLNAVYLAEQSIDLGNFMQAFLLESPSPGLLFCFSKISNFSSS